MGNDLFGLEFDSTNPRIAIIGRVAAGGQADKWNSRADESRRGQEGISVLDVHTHIYTYTVLHVVSLFKY